MRSVTTGLEILAAEPALLEGRRWALLANHAAVTRTLDPARSVLAETAGPPALLFAPEHGLDGVAQDMEAVEDQLDGPTGVPVRSLYGHTAATLRPRAEDLGEIDVLVVDLPDIGSRYYTFAATMDAAMSGCEAEGVEVVVLDRPNPIGGVRREGGPVTPGCESFVSQIPTPIRHGLTLGELSLLLQHERYPALELGVITCRDWSREMWWDATGLPWVPPSPNMPTLETAALYPGLCLVEATPSPRAAAPPDRSTSLERPGLTPRGRSRRCGTSNSRESRSAPPGSGPSSASTRAASVRGSSCT